MPWVRSQSLRYLANFCEVWTLQHCANSRDYGFIAQTVLIRFKLV